MGSQTHERPPRSPDFNPLDFYFWGYIKQKVYAEEPTIAENTKNSRGVYKHKRRCPSKNAE